MSSKSYDFCRVLSEELDPEKLRKKFLASLLELQNVERGSIWVKRQGGYKCIEAAGIQSDQVLGLTVGVDRPSVVGWVIENGKMTIAEPGKDARHFKEVEEGMTIKSSLILCFPLFLKSGEVYGAVQLIDTSAGGNRLNLNEEYLELLQQVIDIGSIALANSLIYSEQLQENLKLREFLAEIRAGVEIIGKSAPFTKVMKVASDYAKTDFPVLVTGESGTGKEIIANQIHRDSSRREKPFLVQNCSAIPETLLESELFGYRKGAFTGAIKDKAGLFEAAEGGTLFLDEIGDMPPHLQARILRVIQDGEIKPLGGTKTRKVDVRIISATNKDLKEEIEKGTFREDLFYRLNVLPVHMPPLRDRREDIPLLLDHFIKKEARRMGVSPKRLTKESMEILLDYPWRGNVRELENFVKHILVVVDGDWITPGDLFAYLEMHGIPSFSTHGEAPPSKGEAIPVSPPSLSALLDGYTWEGLEKVYVLHLLEKNKWHITRAAKEAGVNRSTFDSRMKKLGIRK